MDCLEGMKQIADRSVDAVIADLPYGVLNRQNGAGGTKKSRLHPYGSST